MGLHVPGFAGLSDDQLDVLDIPLGQSVIITGPPGSGKTVMAVYRARMLHDAGRPTQLLTYGNLLSSHVRAAVEELRVDGVVDTYFRWFHTFFRSAYGRTPPTGTETAFDWAECLQIMVTSPPPTRKRRHFIIDEGQDMPRDFYLVLRLAGDSMTVFADENQRITTDQSTIAEISAATGISEIRDLRLNHRNSTAIAQLAATFDTGKLSGSSRIEQPDRPGPRPTLLRYQDKNATIADISAYERAHPQRRIGVILRAAYQVKYFYTHLGGRTANGVQTYLNKKDRGKIPMPVLSRHGITVVTWQSCKGLDFDTVFLPELQSVRMDPHSEEFRMHMYVLTTRARHWLFLQYSGEGTPAVVEALPMDFIDDHR
jgi:superfamily I DNA/RNA helicase